MPNYLFNPAEYPEIGTRHDPADDAFFWAQGPARGAGKVQFADWTPVYEKHADIPNVARFHEQAQGAEGAADHRGARRDAAEGSRLPARPSGTCSRWWSTGS